VQSQTNFQIPLDGRGSGGRGENRVDKEMVGEDEGEVEEIRGESVLD